MNTPTTDSLTALQALLGGLRTIELGQPLENGMPCSPSHPGFRMALLRRHGDRVNAQGGSGANELIVTGGHVGTHLDALCHAAIDGRMFGGVDAHAASVGGAFTVHGVDTVRPFLCRGVLADIPKLLGVPRLEPGFGITADHLRAAFGDTVPGADEVALIRTGWPQLYHDPTAYVGHETGVPGITAEAAEYLADTGVRAVCSDTIATDQILPGVGHAALPAHGVLLVERGVHIMEVLTFEELAAAGVREVLYVAVPLRITGATGSPIRPLALIPREAADVR
ncbi:cyclase family protein [Nocardia sp. CA-151230]|uniref:cyclase family protein n=1 Tax=Nocardia sp. CA-151230 TaxID=3239982 RepID=UPI003D93B960